jgi:hypothetical protein
MAARHRKSTVSDPDNFAKRVMAEQQRLHKLLPDIDEDTLGLIAERRLRPPGSGRKFFIRPGKQNNYVF